MPEHIGTVTSREEKIIQKGDNKGQPFLKVTLEPEKWTYSLFDGQHIKTAKGSNSLKVTWEEDGVYRKVVDVQAVEGEQAVELASAVQSNQEFQRWQSCEVTAREIMCALINQSKDAVIHRFQEYYQALRAEVDGIAKKATTQSPQEEAPKQGELTRGGMMTTITEHWKAIGIDKDPKMIETWCRSAVFGFTTLTQATDEEIGVLYKKALGEIVEARG